MCKMPANMCGQPTCTCAAFAPVLARMPQWHLCEHVYARFQRPCIDNLLQKKYKEMHACRRSHSTKSEIPHLFFGQVYTWTKSTREHQQKENRSCHRTRAYIQKHMQLTNTVCGTEGDRGYWKNLEAVGLFPVNYQKFPKTGRGEPSSALSGTKRAAAAFAMSSLVFLRESLHRDHDRGPVVT
jgi:hypothetical protein